MSLGIGQEEEKEFFTLEKDQKEYNTEDTLIEIYF